MSEPAPGNTPRPDLAGNPGVIATTLFSGVIAVAWPPPNGWVGPALASPAAILGVIAPGASSSLRLSSRCGQKAARG
jgi:hypothetical protein